MVHREFLSLTNDEVKQIVTDIFAAKKGYKHQAE